MVTFNFLQKSQNKVQQPKKKWSHEKITLLAWLVTYYAELEQRDYDHFVKKFLQINWEGGL